MSLFELFTGHNRFENIDLKSLLCQILRGWKTYIKWGVCGLIIGLIICFSIPKEYSVKIILSPEKNKPTNVTSRDNLLFMYLSPSIASDDAYNEYIYAQLLNSSPFLYDLLSVPIGTSGKAKDITLKELLESEKKTWWNIKPISELFVTSQNKYLSHIESHNKSVYNEEEVKLINNLRQRVLLYTIERTGAMQLEVRMQDPISAAQLADTVRCRFESYIHNYRTQKASHKLAYAIEQEQKVKEIWHELQDSLGNYKDSHQNVWSAEGNLTSQRLENEVNLAYADYQASILNRVNAEAELYKNMPVFATVSPSTVPLKPSSPRKLVILSYCIFFSVFIPVVRTIFNKTTMKS